jgi:hypothetical protein
MPDYSKSKVYKMECGGLTYIGSTTQPSVAHRLAGHKKSYKQWCNGKRSNISSFRLFEIGEPTIVLLESVNCNNRDELLARERFHIENSECVNKQIPTQTKKEYYQANYEKILEQKHKYYKTNSEQLKQYKHEYYQANKETRKQKRHEYYLKHKNNNLNGLPKDADYLTIAL